MQEESTCGARGKRESGETNYFGYNGPAHCGWACGPRFVFYCVNATYQQHCSEHEASRGMRTHSRQEYSQTHIHTHTNVHKRQGEGGEAYS